MKKKKITWKKQSPEISKLQKTFLKARSEKTIKEERGEETPQTTNLDASPSFDFPQTELLFPVVEGAESPKEEAIYLLKIAAEVEHALMIQYLYAAYSIKGESDLKKTLISIAIQEMGHFLAVQNLLLSIGGIENVHLGKDEYRPTSSNNPLPFTLKPVSKELLAKFVAIEAPLEIPQEFKVEVETIRQSAKVKAGVKLNPVGGLYMKLFWLFQKDDNPLTNLIPLSPIGNLKAGWHINDNDFLSVDEIQKYDAVYDAWDTSGAIGSRKITLSQVYNREDAIKLIYQISSQGEGTNFDDEIDTHFELFLKAYRNYNQTNVINAPVNPVTRPNAEYTISAEIKNEYSLLWCSLFNNVYTSLLLDIYSSMYYKQYSIESSANFIGIILSSMRTVITLVSEVMLNLPLNSGQFLYNATPRCATPFEIEANFSLENDKSKLDALNREIIDTILSCLTSIENHSDYEKHIEEARNYSDAERRLIRNSLAQAKFYCSKKQNLITINLT